MVLFNFGIWVLVWMAIFFFKYDHHDCLFSFILFCDGTMMAGNLIVKLASNWLSCQISLSILNTWILTTGKTQTMVYSWSLQKRECLVAWRGSFAFFLLSLLNINRKLKLNHKLSRTGITKHILRYLLTKFVAREVYWKVGGVCFIFLRAIIPKSGQYCGITNNNVTTGN